MQDVKSALFRTPGNVNIAETYIVLIIRSLKSCSKHCHMYYIPALSLGKLKVHCFSQLTHRMKDTRPVDQR